MFCVVDRENNFAIVKSGFKTASQANNWAKKNLSKDDVRLWKPNERYKFGKMYRYFIMMKTSR